MLSYLVIAIGSALGGMARYALGVAVGRIAGEAFPWGTLLINVLGSLVIGWFAAATDSAAPAQSQLRLLVMVGLCGGFTTFSSFSLQTLQLARQGQLAGALGNIALSITLCLAAVWAGTLLGQRHPRRDAALPAPVLALIASPAALPTTLNAAAHAAAILHAPLSIAVLDANRHGDLPNEEVTPAVALPPTSPRMATYAAALGAWWQSAAVPMPRLVGGPLDGPIAEAGLVVLSHAAATIPILRAAHRMVLLLPEGGWHPEHTITLAITPPPHALPLLRGAMAVQGRDEKNGLLVVGSAREALGAHDSAVLLCREGKDFFF